MEGASSVTCVPLTPLSFLKRAAFVFGDKTAVIYGDRHYTWKEFFSRVNRLSNALKNVGIKKALEVEIGLEILIPPEPQIVGALGAALLARAELVRKNSGQ